MNAHHVNSGTILLVHGAWADGSSWNKVSVELLRRGRRVVSAQIPLTSLSDDVAVVRRLLAGLEGPVVLAGHSYGGAVITEAGAGAPQVTGLVYIAGIVPDEGESVGQVFGRVAPHPDAPKLAPDPEGYLWVSSKSFREAIAPAATAEEAGLLAINRKPIALRCLDEALSWPAWKDKPSWFLVAESDRMLSPETQRWAARRMGAEVHSLPVDHWPLLSAPAAVADLIFKAAALD